MNITFVLPDLDYSCKKKSDWSGIFSIGLGYLSSALKKKGHKVSLIHIIRPITDEDFINQIGNNNAEVVAFTCFSHQFPMIANLAKLVKEKTGIFTICGGVHATISPGEVIDTGYFDAVCLGEGEETLVDLCDNLQSNRDISHIRSLWIMKNGQVYRNPVRPLLEDLDTRSFPDRSIFDFNKLLDRKWGMLTVLAGRGCPYECSYCCNHQYKRLYPNASKYVRFRNVDKVIEEIENGLSKYSFMEFINFIDDTFALNKTWLEEFCKKYPKVIKLPFHGNCRVNLLSEDVVTLLKEANCEHMSVGIESGNERIRRDVLKRKITDKQIEDAFEICKKKGLKISCYNMIGLPFEGINEILDTIKLNAKINPYHRHTSIFQPYPYTELYELCLENKFIDGKSISTFFGDTIVSQPSISRRQVKFLFKYFEIFVKIYGIIFKLPIYLKNKLTILIDKFICNVKPTRLFLAIHPLINFIFLPIASMKRIILFISPSFARLLKRIIYGKAYLR